jgi:WD40 repeat protein
MSGNLPRLGSGFVLVGLLVIVAGHGFLRGHPQEPNAFARCWEGLASGDAEFAFRATGQLVQNPESAVNLIGKHLRAAETPDQDRIQASIKDLASATFAVRERAFQELQKLGELAEVPLRKALRGTVDLEIQRRIDLLLSGLERPVTSPDKLRQIRAVEVLEVLASPPAKGLLKVLAEGHSEHRQTRQAQEALRRLAQRHPVPARWLAWTKTPPPVADGESPLPFGAVCRLGTTRFRHHNEGIPFRYQSEVSQSAFSPDGRVVISRDRNAVYLWERPTGKLQRKFDIAATSLAIAPQGTLLAVGIAAKDQSNNVVVCWDWQAGQERKRLELPGISPSRLTFSPDGTKVLFQGSGDNLRAWDTRSGEQTTLWQPGDGLLKLHGFSRDGSLVVVEAKERNYLLDLKKNQRHELPAMERKPTLASFSPDGRYVAVGCDYPGERINVCDTATGKHLWRSGDWLDPYRKAVAFSDDGKVMAVSSYRQDISLWDLQTGKHLRSLADSKYCAVGAISADGRWLASSGQTVDVWDLESGQQVSVGNGHRTDIDGLLLSPSYDWIATFDHEEVRLWDALTGEQKRLIDTGGTYVRGVTVSPDGHLVAAGQPMASEGFVKVWETTAGRQVYLLPGHGVMGGGRDADVRFSPDGRFLFSWGDDGYLRKWDMKNGKAVLEVTTQPPGQKRDGRMGGSLVQHAWAVEHDRFLRLEPNGDLRTFDLNSGKQGPVVNVGAKNLLTECALSPAARYIAFYERNSGLAVCDTTTGKLAFNQTVAGYPRGLAFSPDGRSLAAAVADQIVVVETASGKVRLRIGAQARALTFSADGRFLAAAMADATALLWDLATLAQAPRKE